MSLLIKRTGYMVQIERNPHHRPPKAGDIVCSPDSDTGEDLVVLGDQVLVVNTGPDPWSLFRVQLQINIHELDDEQWKEYREHGITVPTNQQLQCGRTGHRWTNVGRINDNGKRLVMQRCVCNAIRLWPGEYRSRRENRWATRAQRFRRSMQMGSGKAALISETLNMPAVRNVVPFKSPKSNSR